MKKLFALLIGLMVSTAAIAEPSGDYQSFSITRISLRSEGFKRNLWPSIVRTRTGDPSFDIFLETILVGVCPADELFPGGR